jgi:hypothetical protein
MAWRVASSLDTLLAEIDKAAPNRSKVSDGSIGDAAHASRASDHNPWVQDGSGVGVVRARDFTDDPERGLDCDALAAFLVDQMGEHPALVEGAYVIWRRRIYSCDRRAEGWRSYSGSNPHDKHLHLSVAIRQLGYDSTRPWGWGEPEDDMPAPKDWTAADWKAVQDNLGPSLARQVVKALLSATITKAGDTVKRALRLSSGLPQDD